MSARLRHATAGAHRALEATPLATALAQGRLTPQAYTRLAWQMWHLHTRIEPVFETASKAWAPLQMLWHPSRERASVLLSDLRALDAGAMPPIHASVSDVVDRVANIAVACPWVVVGPVYVLEGSRLGSMVVGRAVAQAWGAPANAAGLGYHRPPPAGWWAETVRALDALPLGSSEVDQVCGAAVLLMEALRRLYSQLTVDHASSGVPA